MLVKMDKKENLFWHDSSIKRIHREELHGHKGFVIWFTGLSASGKSTIAHELEKRLFEVDCSTYVFDGDNVRHGLCSDLGFSKKDRIENVRRIGEMVNLFVDSGTISITAFISPFRKDRNFVRNLVGAERFIEIYVNCSLDECIKRDPKGIYSKAVSGEIKNFTGVSSEYEPPQNPDIIIDSEKESLEESVEKILKYIMKNERFEGFFHNIDNKIKS
jgi:adenylylsulfate kinase